MWSSITTNLVSICIGSSSNIMLVDFPIGDRLLSGRERINAQVILKEPYNDTSDFRYNINKL
jgi:hypothetical protein